MTRHGPSEPARISPTRGPLRRLDPRRGPPSPTSARGRGALERDDAAQLCGRASALSRAGVPPARTWEVLAVGRGPGAWVAATVAGMLEMGGTTAEGLRLAATDCEGPGVEALEWLAAPAEVVRRSGAPAASIFDGIGAGLLAQIAESDEQEVALAGPRTTARVLAALPLIGLLLGAVLGVNPLEVLLGTAAGAACLLTGSAFWWAGHWWTARLVRNVAASTS